MIAGSNPASALLFRSSDNVSTLSQQIIDSRLIVMQSGIAVLQAAVSRSDTVAAVNVMNAMWRVHRDWARWFRSRMLIPRHLEQAEKLIENDLSAMRQLQLAVNIVVGIRNLESMNNGTVELHNHGQCPEVSHADSTTAGCGEG